jgi:hypothetical protein
VGTWCTALSYYLQILTSHKYRDIKSIVLEYSHVRPKGSALSTFGGTASGHNSLRDMFSRIHEVVTRHRDLHINRVQLAPIDVLDICNIEGMNVVVGGVRRTALLGLGDAQDKEVFNAKSNLYTQDAEGKWSINQDIIFRQMSNNSIYYLTRPSREEFSKHFQVMLDSGEPAWVNAEQGKKRNPKFSGVNPCFRGDMKLLTAKGYRTFKSLDGKDVDIINANGDIAKGKVWCSGEKPIVKVKTMTSEIFCTSDHVFMLNDGAECEAKDLVGKRLMPFLGKPLEADLKYVKLGFLQGDGGLGRIASDAHRGVDVNIGAKDKDILKLFKLEDNGTCNYYIHGYNKKLRRLGFDSRVLPLRTLPSTFNDWSKIQQKSFMQGLYSANGCVHKSGRISFKTTSKGLAEEIVDFLTRMDINVYVTTNKAKVVDFSNGSYKCKESYDINIQEHSSRVLFYKHIGFYHTYKKDKLRQTLLDTAPKVIAVKDTGKVEKVYDFNEPITHWGVVEDVVVHNCAEILLDDKGLCNLTTINVLSFVKDGVLNVADLMQTQRLSARASLRVASIELELHEWNLKQKENNYLGCSLTGWQDMVNATKMSKQAQRALLRSLREVAHTESKAYARELNVVEPTLITTVKPEGSLSQLPTVSSGLHYSHSPYFIRRVRVNTNDAVLKACEALGYPIYPEVGQTLENCTTKVIEFPVKAPEGVTKYEVGALEQLEVYRMFMEEYVDHNASITVHFRPHEREAIEDWMYNNWDTVVGVSFIALDDAFYQLLPYETIDEAEYIKRSSAMKAFSARALADAVAGKYQEHELDSECASGICPVR